MSLGVKKKQEQTLQDKEKINFAIKNIGEQMLTFPVEIYSTKNVLPTQSQMNYLKALIAKAKLKEQYIDSKFSIIHLDAMECSIVIALLSFIVNNELGIRNVKYPAEELNRVCQEAKKLGRGKHQLKICFINLSSS